MRFSKLSTPVSPQVKLIVSGLIQSTVGIGSPLNRDPPSCAGKTGTVTEGKCVEAAYTSVLHSERMRRGRSWGCFRFLIARQVVLYQLTEVSYCKNIRVRGKTKSSEKQPEC